jgi:hypothetical protein
MHANSHRVRLCAIAMMALALAACATRPPERIAYNAEARRDVVRIVVLEPALPESFLVQTTAAEATTTAAVYAGGATWGAGFLVMIPFILAASADQLAKSKTLTQAAADAGFDPGDALAASLVTELERVGFRVTRHRVARTAAATSTEPRWLGDYRPWRDSADAVLDVQWLAIGFRPLNPVAPYTPLASVGVRLVDPRSHRIYYRETLSFGLGPDGGALQQYGGNMPTGLVADDKHRFDDFPALTARRDEAFDALRSAARGIAARIAFDLGPR